ncbi:hypothetical protein HK101_002314 [Irineochytrium annulatum]|nr:hypothetical protein HK101_002314 [Irineochytrium annulatum]
MAPAADAGKAKWWRRQSKPEIAPAREPVKRSKRIKFKVINFKKAADVVSESTVLDSSNADPSVPDSTRPDPPVLDASIPSASVPSASDSAGAVTTLVESTPSSASNSSCLDEPKSDATPVAQAGRSKWWPMRDIAPAAEPSGTRHSFLGWCKRSMAANAAAAALKPVRAAKCKRLSPQEERNARHADVVALTTGAFRHQSTFPHSYKLGELLGDGAFGFVFTARRLIDNQEVAVKFIEKRKIPGAMLVDDPFDVKAPKVPREIRNLMTLRHPTVIAYLDHYDEDRFFLLVTELHGTEWDVNNPTLSPSKNPGLRASKKQCVVVDDLSEEARKVYDAQQAQLSPLLRLTEDQEKAVKRRTSCDLFECIDAHRRIPESTGKRIFAQIALGIDHLHRNDVVHRDLKDENIVINADYEVRIIDFGAASPIPSCEADYFRRFSGTAHYAAPELIMGKPVRGPEAEIWTLGVLLHTIYGENPFQGPADILRGILSFPFRVNSDDYPDDGVRSLIKRMLCYEVVDRATMEEVLEHGWLKAEVERLRAEWEE